MRRREFIAGLGSAAAWPLAAQAQQSKLPVVGLLNSGSPGPRAPIVAAFLQGLKEAGYVVGQNVAIEYRWAEGERERLPTLAADLVRRPVNVIFALGSEEAVAAKAATTMVPIVYVGASDPVAIGLVTSLNRPGGNVTGVTAISHALGAKRLDLLRQLVPDATMIGVLMDERNPSTRSELKDLEAAARAIGLQAVVFYASSEAEVVEVFTTLVQQRASALVSGGGPFLGGLNAQLAALANRHRVPTIGTNRDFAKAGGVMSYGASFTDANRQAAIYVGRILKGEKPADLPVMQPTRFELVVNLKTAKALGLTIPETLLATADEVIQ
jgi:putative tryptophan/tyrosine transport system substrate-binding protein